MPSDPADAKGLLKSAIRDPDPVVFLEHKMLYGRRGEVPDDDDFTIPLGSASLKRPGRDVTVLAIQGCVGKALDAAEELAASDGIEVEVIDPRCLVPFDLPTVVESVRRTSRLVVVQEAQKTASFGAAVTLDVIQEAFGYIDAPVGFVGPPPVPVPYPKELEQEYLPSAHRIKQCIRDVVGRDN